MTASRFYIVSFFIFLAMFIGLAASANAALVDNGDSTVTDTDAGLMWLKDANYAGTSGYTKDSTNVGWTNDYGWMVWNDAVTWAENLVFATYDDWRLPVVPDYCDVSYSPCFGMGQSDSDMGHLYYGEGITSSINQGPFINLQDGRFDAYWYSTVYPDATNAAWAFVFDEAEDGGGDQYGAPIGGAISAWAVRAVIVPEPVSSILFITGGATLGLRRFRKKKRSV